MQTYLALAHNDISLSAVHVASCDNIADVLSWGDIEAFLRGFPEATTRFNISLPPYLSGKLIAA